MIIRRYINAQILKVCFPSLVILLLLFVSNAMVRYLGYAAHGELSIKFFPRLLLIELPGLIGILLPIAFFFATLIVLSKLCSQSELVALRTAGFSNRDLLRSVFYLAIPCALIVACFVLWLRPLLMRVKVDLISQAKASAVIDMFKPRQFQTISNEMGTKTIYVKAINATRDRVQHVFIASEKTGQVDPEILIADKGYQQSGNGSDYFVLEDGALYRGMPGNRSYRITHFKRYQSLIRTQSMSSARDKIETLTTNDLIKGYKRDPEYRAELQWRISIPLILIILAYLAIPLSYVSPRSGTYSKLLPAILLLIVYINSLIVFRHAIEDQQLPDGIGLWCLHIFFIFFGILLNRSAVP